MFTTSIIRRIYLPLQDREPYEVHQHAVGNLVHGTVHRFHVIGVYDMNDDMLVDAISIYGEYSATNAETNLSIHSYVSSSYYVWTIKEKK